MSRKIGNGEGWVREARDETLRIREDDEAIMSQRGERKKKDVKKVRWMVVVGVWARGARLAGVFDMGGQTLTKGREAGDNYAGLSP